MEDTGIYERLDRRAAKLAEAYRQEGLTVNRAGSLLSAFFVPGWDSADGAADRPGRQEEDGRSIENYEDACKCDKQAFAAYFNRMLEHGIYVAPSQFEAIFVSDTHTDALIETTCKAVRACVRQGET